MVDDPIYEWTPAPHWTAARYPDAVLVEGKPGTESAVYMIPVRVSEAVVMGLVSTQEEARAKLHAREAFAGGSWAADLVRGNDPLLHDLRDWLGRLLERGTAEPEARAILEQTVNQARAILAELEIPPGDSQTEMHQREREVASDLRHGRTAEEARDRVALRVRDPWEFYRLERKQLREIFTTFQDERRENARQLREDPVYAAQCAHTFARLALRSSLGPEYHHHAIVKAELERRATDESEPDSIALAARNEHPEWSDRFARRLMERTQEAARILADAAVPTTAAEATRTAETEHGPVLWADAALAAYFATRGATGQAAASVILKGSAKALREIQTQTTLPDEAQPWGSLWNLWLPPVVIAKPDAEVTEHKVIKAGAGGAFWNDSGAVFYRYLARVVWLEEIRPALEREIRNPPALVLRVHEDVTRVYSRMVRVEERNGQRAIVFDDADPLLLVPSVAEEAAQALVERGVDLLGTVTAHRAWRWEVITGHERAQRGETDARVLTIEGGWSVFAREHLALTSKAEADRLKAIVYAQDAVRITLPDGSSGRMLSLREWPAQGQRHGKIEMVLGTMLLPHYVHELGERVKGRKLREARRLIPVCNLPPFVGRARDHGAQATLSMLVVRELRANARELVETGAVRVPLNRWAEFARKAGLPPSLLGKVLDRWTQDGPDAPAFLARTGPDAYTLAKTYTRELAFILEGAKREVSGSEAGRRSVKARAAKMRRLARGGE